MDKREVLEKLSKYKILVSKHFDIDKVVLLE